MTNEEKLKQVKLKVKFIGFDKEPLSVVVDKNKTYLELMKEFEINPETVVIVKDSTPVPLDEKVEEGEIVVMRVISGG